jgi:hypothetical protein
MAARAGGGKLLIAALLAVWATIALAAPGASGSVGPLQEHNPGWHRRLSLSHRPHHGCAAGLL